jgi:hypothetical protein
MALEVFGARPATRKAPKAAADSSEVPGPSAQLQMASSGAATARGG